MSDTVVLGFDTSAAHCAAALLLRDRVVVARAEEMARGQAERLMPLLEEVLAEGGVAWRDLTRLGVGVGPGNFTGIRISVAAGRGLALALGVPAIGVSSFEAAIWGQPSHAVAAVPAPRGQIYVQRRAGEYDLMDRDAWDGPAPLFPPPPAELAERIARIAAVAEAAPGGPAPLYLRPADAAPARDAPPEILD